MNCDLFREAYSAQLDGEDSPLESAAVDAHLSVCPACRGWAAAAARVTRLARVAPAEPVPDLTASIMVNLPAAPAPTPAPTRGGSAPAVARLGLVLIAMAQLIISIPALGGADAGAPVHIAHEQGSWALALAVGLLVVAWRPSRATGILPLMAALVAGLTITCILDVAAGRTVAGAEAPHGLAVLGLALLWLVAHPTVGQRRSRYA
jgi:predicted anti-sigma-YlaC factor YlaD